MIEKMKKVTIFAPAEKRVETVKALRHCGVVHIADLVNKSESSISVEKVKQELEQTLSLVEEKKDKKNPAEQKTLTDEEFDAIERNAANMGSERKVLSERISRLGLERERLLPFGAFRPEDIKALSDKGISLFFYQIGEKDLARLASSEEGTVIVLRKGKQNLIASVGSACPKGYGTTEVVIPEMGLEDIEAELVSAKKRLEEIEMTLASYTAYIGEWKKRIEKKETEVLFERAKSSVSGDSELMYLSGWVPEKAEDKVKSAAKKNGWGYLIQDPADDENPPTLVTYKGPVRIVKPVFDILGTVPGYRETDISFYFLIFFSLFFAMIIGDAGYGLVLMLGAVAMNIVSRKANDLNVLLYVVSAVTMVWGALTGTWFGSAAILEKLPFLQHLVIPAITNFPEVMGVDPDFAQNSVMKFCFIIGSVQLSLACVINICRKLPKKDLSWVADLGWLVDVNLLYFLVLYLVIGAPCNFGIVAGGVGAGFVLVCLFGGQGPGIPFAQGVKNGLAGFFTTFLDTVSCFSNIMSYIRLFAVGLASLAIAQSFNDMASPMLHGMTIPVGILVILIGHTLNLVMGFLSVVVHGVRLNLLEFSGQLGMEWSGYNYEPFAENEEKAQANN